MKRWLVVGILVGFTGCAQWQHPHKTQQDFHADSSQCQALANTAYRPAPPPTTYQVQMRNGYGTVHAVNNETFGQSAMNELAQQAPVTNLYRQCMKGKGYYLAKAEQGSGYTAPGTPNIPNVKAIESFTAAPTDDSDQRPSALRTVYLKYDSVQTYSEPGFHSSVVETVSKSSSLQAISETDYWVKVRTSSGKIGWVAKQWIVSPE